MKSSWGVRPLTTAVAAFCLTLPLWLASCAPSQNVYDAGPSPAAAPEPRPAPPASLPGAGSGLASGSGTTGEGTVAGVSEAVPPTGTASAVPGGSDPGGQTAGAPAAGGSGPGGPPSGGLGVPDPQAQLPGEAGQQPAPASGAAAGPASAGPTAPGSTAPGSTAPGSTLPGSTSPGTGTGTAVYYVAIDDGGRSGVRFGCNDSLVAVRNADSSISEPLQAAMSRLLSGPDAPPASGLYNALSASSLQYVSGYLDGTTVVVNLTGAVQPGGVCDLPRIEAQLTHTAVTAVGAVRAEIYVSGVPLAEVLGLR